MSLTNPSIPALILMLTFCLQACTESGAATLENSLDEQSENEPVLANPDDGDIIFAGSLSGPIIDRDKHISILRSQTSLELAALTYTGEVPPQLDFDLGFVLLLDMGSRNTGGYSVTLNNIIRADNTIQLLVNLNLPDNNCIVTQSFTHPYRLIWVRGTDKAVLTESIETSSC